MVSAVPQFPCCVLSSNHISQSTAKYMVSNIAPLLENVASITLVLNLNMKYFKLVFQGNV